MNIIKPRDVVFRATHISSFSNGESLAISVPLIPVEEIEDACLILDMARRQIRRPIEILADAPQEQDKPNG